MVSTAENVLFGDRARTHCPGVGFWAGSGCLIAPLPHVMPRPLPMGGLGGLRNNGPGAQILFESIAGKTCFDVFGYGPTDDR